MLYGLRNKLIISAVLLLVVLCALGACVIDDIPPPQSAYALLTYVIPREGGNIQIDPPPKPENMYPTGTDVIIKAAPNEGYRFVGWSGDIQENTSPIIVTMDEDKSIIAEFETTRGLSIITILMPYNRSEVPWYQKIEGKIDKDLVGSSLNIYVLIYPIESNGPWWVQELVKLYPDGLWEGYIYFGRDPEKYPEDIGDEFYAITIATKQVLEPGQQWHFLPDSVYKSDPIKVRRK